MGRITYELTRHLVSEVRNDWKAPLKAPLPLVRPQRAPVPRERLVR